MRNFVILLIVGFSMCWLYLAGWNAGYLPIVMLDKDANQYTINYPHQNYKYEHRWWANGFILYRIGDFDLVWLPCKFDRSALVRIMRGAYMITHEEDHFD